MDCASTLYLEYRVSREVEMMQNVVRARYLGVGDALPDLTLPLLGGGELTLRSFRGKYVLLFLWASW